MDGLEADPAAKVRQGERSAARAVVPRDVLQFDVEAHVVGDGD